MLRLRQAVFVEGFARVGAGFVFGRGAFFQRGKQLFGLVKIARPHGGGAFACGLEQLRGIELCGGLELARRFLLAFVAVLPGLLP